MLFMLCWKKLMGFSEGWVSAELTAQGKEASFREGDWERPAHLCNETWRSRSTGHVSTEFRCKNEQLIQL